MGFLAADTAIDNFFFRFIELASSETEQQMLMHNVIRTSIERWNLSDMLVNELTKEACRHPNQTSLVIRITNAYKTECNLDESWMH